MQNEIDMADCNSPLKESESVIESLSGLSYLSGCSKVTLDAYNRVLKHLQEVKDEEAQLKEAISLQIKKEEEKEKSLIQKQKNESLAAKKELEKQIKEKHEKKLMDKIAEKDSYKASLEELPKEVVVPFPRIIQTPREIRREKEKKNQEEMKKLLEEQIAKKNIKENEEKNLILEQENEIVRKAKAEALKEAEEFKLKNTELLEKWKNGLTNDIQYKQMKKLNEKRLEGIEYDGIMALQQILSKKEGIATQAEKKEEKKEEDLQKSQQSKPLSEFGVDKLAALLAKKQEKAKALLKKVAEMENGTLNGSPISKKLSLSSLKNALTPTGYKMNAEGKQLRLSNSMVEQMIQQQKKSKEEKTDAPKIKAEKIEQIALGRYLTQLDSQASEEHKRIMESLKREHEAIDRLKQQENGLKNQRLIYRQIILDQIMHKRQKKEDAKLAKQSDPNQLYPPIVEPSLREQKEKLAREYKTQRSIWIKQVFFVYFIL